MGHYLELTNTNRHVLKLEENNPYAYERRALESGGEHVQAFWGYNVITFIFFFLFLDNYFIFIDFYSISL